MTRDLASRLHTRYSGEAGEAWARIERETPATYWEENAVLGRRDLHRSLAKRLGSLEGRRILDAGCGRGLTSWRLAGAGARVTGVDLSPSLLQEASAREGPNPPRFVAADVRHLPFSPGAFDDVVVQEVLEELEADEWLAVIRQLAACEAPRIHMAFRQRGRWGGLLGPVLPEALIRTLDPVSLMRSVHLHTPYRISDQEPVRRRSYNVLRVEFTLRPDSARSNLY